MFSRTVHPRKGLLMKQCHELVMPRHVLDRLHEQLVGIGRDVGRIVYCGNLKLVWSYLVVLCLGRDTEPPQLIVELLHEQSNPLLDRTKVVIIHLLSFCTGSPEHSSAAQTEIQSSVVELLIDEKVLLLRSHMGDYPVAGGVAQCAQDP